MSGPTFGQTIRGARLGYAWMPSIGAFVRISPAGGNDWLVEAVPPERLPKSTRGEHVVWWEGGSREAATEAVRRYVAGDLREVRLRRPIAFRLDTEGRGAPVETGGR